MKKIIFAACAILIMAGCKKDTTGNLSGSWTFKDNNSNQTFTYHSISCAGSGVTLTASTDTVNGTYSLITFQFLYPAMALPAHGGTDTIGGGTFSGQIAVSISTTTPGLYGFTEYTSTGIGVQTVSVTVSGGKVALSGSNISMLNNSVSGDFGVLSFNIVQQ